MVKWIVLALVLVSIAIIAAVDWYVQHEDGFSREVFVEAGQPHALILYHPSRDAHFAEELALALARGFAQAGYSVEIWSMSSQTPARPQGFQAMALVSNTFFWSPDRPTRTYLGRAHFHRIPAIAIAAGGGSTQRAELQLANLLKDAGADLRGVRPFWTSRPNGNPLPGETNRTLAGRLAREWAFHFGQELANEAQQHAQPE